MGGDIFRVLKLGNYIGDKQTAAASVVVERFTGMVTLIIFAIISVLINIHKFNQIWLTVSILLGVLLMLTILVITLSQTVFDFLKGWFRPERQNRYIKNIFHKIEKIRQAILEYSTDNKAILFAFLNSIIFQLLAVVNVWIAYMVFYCKIDFITCLLAVPIVLFIMNIPVSIGGIGLMEFGYVFTFSLFGIPPAVTLSTVLLIRVKSIFDSLIGGILYLIT